MPWKSAGLGLDGTHTFSEVALLTVLSCWLVSLQAGGAAAAGEALEEAVTVDLDAGALLAGSTGGVDADFTCTTAI